MGERLDASAVIPGDGDIASTAYAERMVFVALANGVQLFRDDPTWWDRIHGFLEAAEREAVKGLFSARPPSVRHGYARDTDPWPVIGITLAGESVNQEYIGDFLGIDDNGDEVQGHIDDVSVDITIYADNPDVVLHLYHFAKFVLQSHVGWFQSVGLMAPSFMRGNELAAHPGYLPEQTYIRRISYGFMVRTVASLPMPDPPRSLYVMSELASQGGHTGRVRPTRSE